MSDKFNFDELIDRRHTNSVKWSGDDQELPMWVADMDFRTAPAIVAAIQKRAAFGIFGYETIPDEYFQAVVHWWQAEHQVTLKTEWLLFVQGVVPAITSVIKKLTTVGDNVLVQAPVYDIFYHSIENTGRHVLSSDLKNVQDDYQIDFADLEAKLADPLTRLMIICNPHNPIGIVWSRATLQRIGELCLKHHVVALVDEIHGDLTLDEPYTPFSSLIPAVAANSISCVSPSKTFNVAALHAATLIVPDADLRAQVDRGINSDELAEPNSFAIPATIAAYTDGAEWLHSLKDYLRVNQQLVTATLAKQLPSVKVLHNSATYLMWLDCRNVTTDSAKLADYLVKNWHLRISAGSVYRGDGRQFIRLNIACPKARLQDGLQRLVQGVQQYQLDKNRRA